MLVLPWLDTVENISNQILRSVFIIFFKVHTRSLVFIKMSCLNFFLIPLIINVNTFILAM